MEEEMTYEPSEAEITLYTLSQMVDTLLSQMVWMRELIEQELDRIADEQGG